MEHLLRVQNERDRQVLAWLRAHVGDEAIADAVRQCGGTSKPYLSTVCRRLGVVVPRTVIAMRVTPSRIAQASLASIREILAARKGSAAADRSDAWRVRGAATRAPARGATITQENSDGARLFR